MTKLYTLLILLSIVFYASAQNTYDDVYQIFQNNCVACHSNSSPTAGLDLEGAGATLQAKMADVYANLYNQNPSNTAATANKNHLVYPGDPYKSFLYRKIDHGLTPGLTLGVGEGASEPNSGSALADKEIELIRQWIVYGAQETGTHFDKTLMEEYYDDGGVASIENPPMPPAEGEGFQVHLGPFFLAPGGEIEYFTKYEPQFDSDLEIYKLQTEMGDYSHHFITYKFNGLGGLDPATVPYGLRDVLEFDSKELITVDQYSNTLNLPEGSAFKWDQNTTLDLNTHYINYSNTQVLKCEVFFNVYTQDIGTANQEMEVALIPETNIPIPNNNIPVTFTSDFQLGANVDLFVWGLVAHTHKYGKDFNIYKKNPDGSRGVQVYDAGCSFGEPGCAVEDFDYSHLPLKLNYPFEQVNIQHGFEAEATYQNDGPSPVNWGFTSDDEMMIFVAFYVTDTTGVKMEEPSETIPNPGTGISDFENHKINLFPNPSDKTIYIKHELEDLSEVSITFYDFSGKKVYLSQKNISSSIDIQKWNNGIYFYEVRQNGVLLKNGKFIKK